METIGGYSENAGSSKSGSIEITLNINTEREPIAGYNIIFMIDLFGISIRVIQKGENRFRST